MSRSRRTRQHPERVARYIELRRHTDNEEDVLTREGVDAAMALGKRMSGDYKLLVSSGAQRATQTIACFVSAWRGRSLDGVVVDSRFKSEYEDRWKAAYKRAGAGDIKSFLEADRDLVEKESGLFARALVDLFEALPEGARGMVVGHSPMHEAAVWKLTGKAIEPLGKGEGVTVVRDDDGSYEVEEIE